MDAHSEPEAHGERLARLEEGFRQMRVEISDIIVRQSNIDSRLTKTEIDVLKFNTAAQLFLWIGGAILALIGLVAPLYNLFSSTHSGNHPHLGGD